MKKKFLALFMAFMLLCPYMIIHADTAKPSYSLIVTELQNNKVRLDFMVKNFSDIYAAQVNVSFNKSVLQSSDSNIQGGTVITQSGSDAVVLKEKVDNEKGLAAYCITKVGEKDDKISEGTLFSITFDKKTSGSYNFQLSSGIFSNNKGESVEVQNIVPVTSVALNKSSAELKIGETVKLEATVKPDNATNKKVNWSSNNRNIATVDELGNVSAVAKGTAVITATTEDGSKTASCDITVVEPTPIIVDETGITIDRTSLGLKIGEETTLSAEVTPVSATYRTVTWTSSNNNIATVENGKIKAVGEGSAEIIVTSTNKGITAKCQVTVTKENTAVVTVNNNDEEVKNKLADPAVTEVKVDASQNRTATEEIFKELIGKDKVVTFEVGNVQWSFNGKDLKSQDLKDIDLSLIEPSENVSNSIESKVKGEDVFAISFKHDGKLPGKATVKIKLDSNWLQGKDKNNIFMYYFNPSSNKVEAKYGPYKVDDQGFITVELEHCSDYFFADKDLIKAGIIPKTGGMIDFALLLTVGIVMITAGSIVAGRRKILGSKKL